MEKYNLPKLKIDDIEGLRVGHAQNADAATGVTVLYFDHGANVGVDISGGGPASRETPLASPVTAPNPLNAIVLSGGSAFGLAASDGVMHCLEDNGIGYDTGFARVPLVAQSCIFDLGYGAADIRPDAKMGFEACEKALIKARDKGKCVGAATGATVGKLKGMEFSQKTGLGYYGVQIGQLQMAAIVVVNALGDIIDPSTGKIVAGMNENGEFSDSFKVLLQMMQPHDMFTSNTTIGAIITNAQFNKADLTKIASMTRNAYARCISPVGTMADGDTIYAASLCEGDLKVDINMAGSLAAYVMEQAILDAAQAEE